MKCWTLTFKFGHKDVCNILDHLVVNGQFIHEAIGMWCLDYGGRQCAKEFVGPTWIGNVMTWVRLCFHLQESSRKRTISCNTYGVGIYIMGYMSEIFLHWVVAYCRDEDVSNRIDIVDKIKKIKWIVARTSCYVIDIICHTILFSVVYVTSVFHFV